MPIFKQYDSESLEITDQEQAISLQILASQIIDLDGKIFKQLGGEESDDTPNTNERNKEASLNYEFVRVQR